MALSLLEGVSPSVHQRKEVVPKMPMLKRTLEVVGRWGGLPTWEEAFFVYDEMVATPTQTIPPDGARVGPRAVKPW